MGLADYLRTNNGLKTTQSVLNKQQSGVDAAQKASPEQINMNTAQAMLHGKEEQLTPPKDAHEQAVRMNQQTAEGMLNGSIPIVKKEEPKPEPMQEPEKKQLTYAEMYKMLNPADSESPEQRAQREKNEKRKARIAALGDGLRALANIYFASKGAKVVHNPESDMTAAINKRKAYMDAQREKNRAAWQAGYQRALAQDEEARKNNLTLAEQIRHNVENESIARGKLDQSQQRIDQGNRRLDLSEIKINSDADYKNYMKVLKTKLADGQLKHWQAVDAAATLRARRAGRSTPNKEDYDSALLDISASDQKGLADAYETVGKAGQKGTPKRVVTAYRKNKAKASSKGSGKIVIKGVNWVK